MSSKPISVKRNPYAGALKSPLFKPQIIPNKKKSNSRSSLKTSLLKEINSNNRGNL